MSACPRGRRHRAGQIRRRKRPYSLSLTSEEDPVSESYGELSRLSPQVQEAWTRFEVAWADGQRPAIEDYLGGFAEPERRRLFYELLMCELKRRRGQGETPERG